MLLFVVDNGTEQMMMQIENRKQVVTAQRERERGAGGEGEGETAERRYESDC